jgi:hypothetical protein
LNPLALLRPSNWQALLRPGDWLVLLTGALAVAWLTGTFWFGAPGQRLIIKSGGQVFLETLLTQPRIIDVGGPLGITRVQIAAHRARVLADPGPRQLCVHQGWLSRAGEAAICLPNQVSVEIAGRVKAYDSLNY